MTEQVKKSYRPSIRDIRLFSGLAIGAFVTSHLINHALGLLSIEAMEAYRKVHSAIWQSPPGVLVLYGSFVAHFLLALYAVFQRSHLRLKIGSAVQLAFGLLIPLLLIEHVVGSRVVPYLFEFDATYYYAISFLWLDDVNFWQQTALIVIVWVHFCVGLHFWLRVKASYEKCSPLFYSVVVVIPLLGWLGFVQAGKLVERMTSVPGWMKGVRMGLLQAPPEKLAAVLNLVPISIGVFVAILVAALLARVVRRLYRNRHGVVRINYPEGKTMSGAMGPTILEFIQTAGIPHASVCGGRGRCTTCRVQITQGIAGLEPPSEIEAKALHRITAPADVRLACQARPQHDVSIVPLLPPSATARDGRLPGGVQGQERQVAILFVDLRGSTKLGEDRLPYDVMLILNRFFFEMSEALKATKGHYAQFTGDGLMALYGLETGYENGCREAIEGAVEMQRRMERLNRTFEKELGSKLRIGVGVHSGDAIVGTMGPPTTRSVSSIGDNVNIAARLEGLTKDFECGIVISVATAETAGVDLSSFPRHDAELRGRGETISIYTLPDDADPMASSGADLEVGTEKSA
jgi:adenylate cyclase